MLRSAEAVEGDAGFQLAMMSSNQLEWDGIEEQKAALAEAMPRIISRGVAAASSVRISLRGFGMVMCGVTATMYYRPGSADWRRYLELILHGVCAP